MKKILGLVVGFVLFSTSSVFACSCFIPDSIDEQISQSDAIFYGIPVSTHWVLDNSDGFSFLKSTKFAVYDVIKGNIETRNDEDPKVGYVYVRHKGGSPAACGSSFGRGIAYEVFAIETKNRLYIGLCNLTRIAPIPEYENTWEDYRKAASQEQE